MSGERLPLPRRVATAQAVHEANACDGELQ